VVRLAADRGGGVSWLYVAAKAPLPGEAKTRLGAVIGHEAAAALYGAFLADLSSRLHRAGLPPAWFVSPGSWPVLEPLVGPAVCREQRGATWAARQANLFRDAAADGDPAVVLVASDSPQLDVDAIRQAFAALGRADVVLGPTDDGGYYLVGMHGFHDVLDHVRMSTSSARQDVMRCARALCLRVETVAATFDVDTVEDLHPLAEAVAGRRDLPATARALERLLVPEPRA
jgi:rSAM/selenodomain-associated transferase 1